MIVTSASAPPRGATGRRCQPPGCWSRLRVRVPSSATGLTVEPELGTLALKMAHRGGGAPGHIAINGKRLRGSATATAPGVHLLAAFSDALGGVIGQLQLAPDSNEITAALELLKTLPLSGGVVTGDAI